VSGIWEWRRMFTSLPHEWRTVATNEEVLGAGLSLLAA